VRTTFQWFAKQRRFSKTLKILLSSSLKGEPGLAKSSKKVAVLSEFFQSCSKISFSVGRVNKEFSVREIVFRSRKSKLSFSWCPDLSATSIAKQVDTFGQSEIRMCVVAIFLATFQLASDSSCLGRTIALWAVAEDLEYCAVGNLA